MPTEGFNALIVPLKYIMIARMLRTCQRALQDLDGPGFVVDAPCSRPRQMLYPQAPPVQMAECT